MTTPAKNRCTAASSYRDADSPIKPPVPTKSSIHRLFAGNFLFSFEIYYFSAIYMYGI